MNRSLKILAFLTFVALFALELGYRWKIATTLAYIFSSTMLMSEVILSIRAAFAHRMTGMVHNPPGTHLTWLADFFCSPKTMERVVNPLICDMRTEYFEALAENRRVKAAWIRIRYCWSFWKALGLHVVVRNLAEIWKIARMR